MPRLKVIFTMALVALFAPALFALDTQNSQPAEPAEPGTLNYIQGSASLNGQTVSRNNIGSESLAPGQVLSTTNGRAEVLLTPGVYLRLGHNSAVRMVSPDIVNTVLAVERGRADVEVDQLFKENDIHILLNQVPIQIVRTGLYEFNADNNTVMVLNGVAAVDRGGKHWTTVKSNHELSVAEGVNGKPQKFNVAELKASGLYRWGSLRSDYLAEANEQMAGEYGAGYTPGWYWDPYMWDYTFLGAYPFYSPFGWGFYPFGLGAGFYGPGFWGGGFYGGGYGHGYGPGPHGPVNPARGGFGGSAFRAGGGFGGFHGGGGFGGGHGR